MATWFVTDSGMFIHKDAIQIHFIKLLLKPIDGLTVVSQIWAMLRIHHQINSLFAVQCCGGYVGHMHQIQLLIRTSPLGHKFNKYHFKLVWLDPVLIINLEDCICYTFSPFLLYFWQWQTCHCCFGWCFLRSRIMSCLLSVRTDCNSWFELSLQSLLHPLLLFSQP